MDLLDAISHEESGRRREAAIRSTRSGASSSILATAHPEPGQQRAALGLAGGLLALFIAAAPFAKVQLVRVDAFLPIYQSALISVELITAVLLIGEARFLRSAALLVLTGGYVFSASMAVAHALTFPGLFSPGGLLGAGPQTAAWLYFLWHAGFAILVLGYRLLKDAHADHLPSAARFNVVLLAVMGSVFALAAALTLCATAGQGLLPPIMDGNLHAPAKSILAVATWALGLATLAVLWTRRPHSVLDLWLIVVMWAWLLDSALAGLLNHGRFDVGWYAGRVYGLLASSFVLIALLVQNNALRLRFVTLHLRERRRAEDKLRDSERLKAELERRVAQRAEQVRRLAAELEAAEMRERRHIAQDLHDDLGQKLAVVRIRLARLCEHEREDVRATAGEVAGLVAQAYDSTHSLAAQLAPPALYELGLVPALQSLAEEIEADLGFIVVIEDDGEPKPLSQDARSITYRAVRELLMNAAKHANVNTATIRTLRQDTSLIVTVSDQGSGFDSRPGAARREGFGLASVRERMGFIGGLLEMLSVPGAGTTATVTVPLSDQDGPPRTRS